MAGQGLLGGGSRGVTTYIDDDASAKARAAVKPVIVLELIDFYALAIIGRRADLCHSRGAGLPRLGPGQQGSLRGECIGVA
jgi:hypothetical protein